MRTFATWFLSISIALISFNNLAFSTDTTNNETTPVEKEAKKDKKPKWDVNNPPGERKTVSIDTSSTTWSSLDVSPDGKTIVFDMLGDIYVVSVEGGNAKALTSEIAWNMQPKFSPDGSKIAFISDRKGGDNLWIMNADGTDMKEVSKEEANLVHSPSWSPDGNYIAVNKGFVGARSIPGGEIWLYHIAGGSGYMIIKRIGGEQAQKTIGEPAFSPDGRYIYYAKDVTPGTVWQYNKNPTKGIYQVRRLDRETGKDVGVAGGSGGAIAPTPSSDGKYLAYVKRVDTKTVLFVKDLKTGVDKPVFNNLDRDLQETFGMQGNYPSFNWTPDNQSIIFWAGGKIQRVAIKDRTVTQIPVRVKTEKSVLPALRFPVEVSSDEFDVKMIRWAQKSPVANKIVFQALGKIYVLDVNSGKRKRLTKQNDHFEFYPTISPDGKMVVYVTWDDQKLGTVRKVSIRGGRSKQITKEPGHYVEPAFSNDGKKIVFRRFTGGYLTSPEYSLEPGIYMADVTGKTVSRVFDKGRNPQFTPDGKRVLFSEFGWGAKAKLSSVNLNGKDFREHLTGMDITEFSLSPDGQWIAFTQQFNAFVAPFTLTGKSEPLTKDSKTVKVKQISKRSGEYLNWSRDSQSINWALGATHYQRDLKDAFAHLTGSPKKLPKPVSKGIDLSFSNKSDIPSGIIALVGADIVTMRNANEKQEVIKDGVILVEGNRIKLVGKKSEIEIPAKARVFDMAGRTITPGLVDVHAHGGQGSNEITPQQNWMSYSSLAYGVTTIHDPSNDTSEIFSASEMQRAGIILSPRIYSTGTILYGAKAPGYMATIETLEDAKFHLQRLKELGAISVKSYQQPRRDQKQKVIQAGKELGIMVVPEGGAKFHHNMGMIADGHTGIEHAMPLAELYDDVTQYWSQTEVGYSPTFGVAYGGLSGETYWYDRTNVWEDEKLLQWTPRYFVDPNSIRRTTAPDDHYNHFSVAKNAKKLRDAGVPVLIGAHGQREGLAAHWEMWMMEQGGFTPWEALRGATIDGARYLGMDKDIGSIEGGKLADLVIIDGDLLSTIRKSVDISYTMLNGRLYDAKNMNEVGQKKPKKRKLFFFERLELQDLPEATFRALELKQQQYHWRH